MTVCPMCGEQATPSLFDNAPPEIVEYNGVIQLAAPRTSDTWVEWDPCGCRRPATAEALP